MTDFNMTKVETSLPTMERVVPASTFYTQGPAPNAYNLPQELGDKSMKYKNTPKWSMGGPFRDPPPRKDLSGPGAYSPNINPTAPKAPTWAVGTAPRMPLSQREGRGNPYNLPETSSFKFSKSPRSGFPQSPRNSDYWSQGGRGNPGPGSYDPSGSVSQFRGKRPESYSMAGLLSSRASPLLKTDRPGPGSYRGEDPGPTTSSSSAWKFGVAPRGVSSRLMTGASRLPGPASYSLNSAVGYSSGTGGNPYASAPRYTMKGKRPLQLGKAYM